MLIKKKTLRFWAPLIVTLSLLSTAASCPPHPAPAQQEQRLLALARVADVTLKIVNIVEAAQDTEIALFNTKAIASFSLEQHQKYQAAFVKFASVAEPQVKLLKAASTADATRAQSIKIVEKAAQELIAEFKGTPSPVLAAIFATLQSTLLLLEV